MRHFFEIFDYSGSHVTSLFYLKLFSSATCNLKVLSYWSIFCVQMITCSYRNVFGFGYGFFLHLHFGLCSPGFGVTFLLCPSMIFDILFMQLQLILTVWWFKILWSLWFLGQCFDTNWRNVFATFAETDLLKGGLSHIFFEFRVFGFSDLYLVYLKSTL